MLLTLAATALLLCLGVVFARQRMQRASAAPRRDGLVFMGYGDRPLGNKPIPAPSKSAPAKSAATKGFLLTLRVPDKNCACEFARAITGKSYSAEDAPKLPLAGCGVIACRCSFERITDRRRKNRRADEERRELIRFETKDGRRKQSDRRKQNTRWNGPR
ncbi:MAG TPA: hypothetical protein VFB32_13765 [Rudaea sp.]|nr:hypothetical protein [Rudaea sp.]